MTAPLPTHTLPIVTRLSTERRATLRVLGFCPPSVPRAKASGTRRILRRGTVAEDAKLRACARLPSETSGAATRGVRNLDIERNGTHFRSYELAPNPQQLMFAAPLATLKHVTRQAAPESNAIRVCLVNSKASTWEPGQLSAVRQAGAISSKCHSRIFYAKVCATRCSRAPGRSMLGGGADERRPDRLGRRGGPCATRPTRRRAHIAGGVGKAHLCNTYIRAASRDP